MLYCEKCRTAVRGNLNFCPLCQGELTGTPESEEYYPRIRRHTDVLTLSVRIAALATIIIISACAVISYQQSGGWGGWWLYTVAGGVSLWLPFGVAVKRRDNVTKSIIFTTLTSCLIAFFWDLFSGYKGWSLDFVQPIACCAAMLAMAITARVQKLRIEQYIYYLILDIVFGIVPLVLLLCGVIATVLPSVICVAASMVSLAALLLFQGKALRAELIRRTHI